MRAYVWPTLALIAAAAVQGNLPPGLSLLGGKPDPVLIVLIAFALARNPPEAGAALGFIAGLIQGSAVGMSMGSFVITRTVTGLLAGFVNTRLFRDNPVVPTASALWLTAACEGLFLLANPRASLASAFRAVLGECILNALFTLALCLVLRHFETRRRIRLADARL